MEPGKLAAMNVYRLDQVSTHTNPQAGTGSILIDLGAGGIGRRLESAPSDGTCAPPARPKNDAVTVSASDFARVIP